MKMRRVEGSVREDGRRMKRTRKGGEEAEKKDSGVNKKIKKKNTQKEKMKERGPRGRQRPTCLKSLKARSNVSPWKPATGPALAKPVGKYKPATPSPPPERGKRGGGGKKK